MAYISPADVISPKTQWKLVDVISDGGPAGPAYAIGTWDGVRRIGFRWNGTDENPIGNPQSRGLPTWTMLDEGLHSAIIAIASDEKQAMMSAYLGIPKRTELKVDYHPSGRRTLKEKEFGSGQFYRDLRGELFGNNDPETFYRNVAAELSRRLSAGQSVVYVDTDADG